MIHSRFFFFTSQNVFRMLLKFSSYYFSTLTLFINFRFLIIYNIFKIIVFKFIFVIMPLQLHCPKIKDINSGYKIQSREPQNENLLRLIVKGDRG